MTQSNTQFQYMGIPPLWSFSQCTVRYDPIQYPILIQGKTTPMIILSMYLQVWPNPIPNSNTWVHHPYDHLVNVPSDMTQSNTQFQYMSTPPLWSIIQFTVRYDLQSFCQFDDHFLHVEGGGSILGVPTLFSSSNKGVLGRSDVSKIVSGICILSSLPGKDWI